MHNNWNVYKKGSKRQIIRNGQHISNQVEQYRWTISSWCCTVRSPNTDTVINSDCKSNALLPDWKLATNNRLEYIQSTRTMQSSPSCSKHHPELTSSRASSTCACEIDVWHKEHAALSLNADGRVRRMRHPERQPTTLSECFLCQCSVQHNQPTSSYCLCCQVNICIPTRVTFLTTTVGRALVFPKVALIY
jgi:hypothetical protein